MPTQIIERAPRAIPRRRFIASTLFALSLALLLALKSTPVAAQLAIDLATSASGKTITSHTGYTANCAAQTAGISGQNSSAITPDVSFAMANQSTCAITRRMAQARSDSNVDAGQSKVTFWGGGYYDGIESDTFSVEFDGRLRTAYLGFDIRPRSNLLAGLMVSHSEVDIDYIYFDDGRAKSGDYNVQVTGANPYINWNAPDEQLELWAMAGYGVGDSEITPRDSGRLTTDMSLQTLGVGVGMSSALVRSDDREMRVKADALVTRTEVEGDEVLSTVKVDTTRARLMLEASHMHALADGVQLEPSVDVGVRFDDREGETGTGTEVGVKLRYTDPAFGLTIDFSGRTLIRHNRGDENHYENYYNEWDFSIGGSWRSTAGVDGQGVSFSVNPGHGEIIDGDQPTWQTLLDAVEKKRRMSARVEYGLPTFGGLLTPYSEIPLGESNKVYRLGAHWSLDSFLNLKLTGERHDKNHAISLTGEMRF